MTTPYWNNEMTPFLRWETGDYVSYYEKGDTDGHLSVYPMIRHAARTSGFFKVRGININHADFEDFMHRRLDITDFKVEVEETDTLDLMRVSIEISGTAKTDETTSSLQDDIRKTFELSPEIAVLDAGTLEKELQAQVKQQRFVDKRG